MHTARGLHFRRSSASWMSSRREDAEGNLCFTSLLSQRRLASFMMVALRNRATSKRPRLSAASTILWARAKAWRSTTHTERCRLSRSVRPRERDVGNDYSQHQVGSLYYEGRGVDHKQARAWFEKAAAQDYPNAILHLGAMYFAGNGVTSSCRRARECFKRTIGLGHSQAVETMQNFTEFIQKVRS